MNEQSMLSFLSKILSELDGSLKTGAFDGTALTKQGKAKLHHARNFLKSSINQIKRIKIDEVEEVEDVELERGAGK